METRLLAYEGAQDTLTYTEKDEVEEVQRTLVEWDPRLGCHVTVTQAGR